jgi:hypothetical protein
MQAGNHLGTLGLGVGPGVALRRSPPLATGRVPVGELGPGASWRCPTFVQNKRFSVVGGQVPRDVPAAGVEAFQLATSLDRAGHAPEARSLWENVLEMAAVYKDDETTATAQARFATRPRGRHRETAGEPMRHAGSGQTSCDPIRAGMVTDLPVSVGTTRADPLRAARPPE